MPKICDPPPFTGGQMDNTLYNIVIEGKRTRSTGEIITTTHTYNYFVGGPKFGKIRGIRIEQGVINNRYTINAFLLHGNGKSGIAETLFLGRGDQNDRFFEAKIIYLQRSDGNTDTGGDLPETNCRCSPDSCRVDCASEPDGFCCIDHSFTDELLQRLRN